MIKESELREATDKNADEGDSDSKEVYENNRLRPR